MASLLNNKKICDNLRDLIPFPYTEKDAVFFINAMKDGDPVTVFAMEYNDAFCGVISLVPQKDVYSKGAEIGYWLGEPFWNRGIVTTAVRLMTEYGFQQLGFSRLFAGVFEYNPSSMKVLEKNGYKKMMRGQSREGTWEGAWPFHPKTELIRGILKEDCAKLMKDFFKDKR